MLCLIARMQLLLVQFTFLPVAAAEAGLSMDLSDTSSLDYLKKSLEFHRSVGNIKHINIFKRYFYFSYSEMTVNGACILLKKSLRLKCS